MEGQEEIKRSKWLPSRSGARRQVCLLKRLGEGERKMFPRLHALILLVSGIDTKPNNNFEHSTSSPYHWHIHNKQEFSNSWRVWSLPGSVSAFIAIGCHSGSLLQDHRFTRPHFDSRLILPSASSRIGPPCVSAAAVRLFQRKGAREELDKERWERDRPLRKTQNCLLKGWRSHLLAYGTIFYRSLWQPRFEKVRNAGRFSFLSNDRLQERGLDLWMKPIVSLLWFLFPLAVSVYALLRFSLLDNERIP